MNFGESESSLVDRDKSLVEGMLVTEKKEMALLAPLRNETTVVPATAGPLGERPPALAGHFCDVPTTLPC